MAPLEPGHAFPTQNPRELGTIFGYLTAKSEALFARILRCLAALEGSYSSLTTLYLFHNKEKVF